MKCRCVQLSELFEPNPDEEFSEFLDSVNHIESSEEYSLFLCPSCSQYYAVEQWSRGPIVVKIETKEEFTSFDDVPYRKKLFIDSCGGLSDKKCIQAGCEAKALISLVFCAEHAFEW